MRLVLVVIAFWSSTALCEECASLYIDLAKTPRLKSVQAILLADMEQGFVNETKGSYFLIDTRGEMQITFFTTAIFDLYKVRRKGPLKICDTGEALIVDGIDRREPLVIEGAILVIGPGGPRKNFTSGPMPEHLRKLASE